MSNNERIRGLQVYRPIIYGSHARLLTEEERLLAPPSHTHRWTVFLTSATSPPPDVPTSSIDAPPVIDMDYLPGGADDLSYLIKKVTFRLHETYTNPARVFDKPPFKVTETGWGEFTVNIRVQFVSESGEKPMTLAHPIKLHHWGVPVTAPPPPPVVEASETPAEEVGPTDSAAVSPTPTPAAEGATPAPAETAAPIPPPPTTIAPVGGPPTPPAETDVNMDAPSPPSAANPETTTTAPVPTETAPSTPLGSTALATVPPTPISIAARYPVHCWQYDELVFSDPPAALLNLMNEHPPTALPPRNRRARDQREEHEVRKGKKGKKSKESAAAAGGSNVSGLISGENPGTGLAALTAGIPGEPGSADVPLEFSQEMEKGEWNRLNEARIRIVEEMDNWRIRLIAQEKELAKVKGEMKAVV